MTNEEKVEYLLKKFGDEFGNVDQKAYRISNNQQQADNIYNNNQVIKPNYETMSKEELIARIKELENE